MGSMTMAGDAETQPADSVESLSDLAGLMDEGEQEADAPEIEEDGGEQEAPQDDAEEEEDAGEEDAEDEPQDEPTVTIKHDGKEITLKQSEALELAQQGFDYTKKTMAVAEERKAVEQQRAHANELLQKHEEALGATLDRLNAFAQFMETQVGTPPDIALAQQDAALYLAQKQMYEDRRGQLQRAHEAVAQVQQEAQRLRQARIVEQADRTEKELRDTLPGWTDNTLPELADYLGKSGITPQNAGDAFVQKGLWELAHKAKAYDAILAKKAELKPVAQLPKVAKPQSGNQPNRAQQKREAAEKAYKAKPSLENLAKFL